LSADLTVHDDLGNVETRIDVQCNVTVCRIQVDDKTTRETSIATYSYSQVKRLTLLVSRQRYPKFRLTTRSEV
jgi:hypothetical protein